MWEFDSLEKISQLKLWVMFSEVLSLGGQFYDYGQGVYFEVFYFGLCWFSEVEFYEYGVVIGVGVCLCSGLNINMQILKNFFYDLVKYLEIILIEIIIGGEIYFWIKVEFVDGIQGFFYGKFYCLLFDFCVGF